MEEVRSDQNLKEISVTKRVKQAPTSKSKLKQKMVKRRGRWLLSEHFRYLYASFTKGNDIKNIQKHVKTRSIQQIRSHSHKYLTKVREIFEKNCLQTKEEYRSKLINFVILSIFETTNSFQLHLHRQFKASKTNLRDFASASFKQLY